MITIKQYQNKCRVEWEVWNNHVVKRDYWFVPLDDVIKDIKSDVDYQGEEIVVEKVEA